MMRIAIAAVLTSLLSFGAQAQSTQASPASKPTAPMAARPASPGVAPAAKQTMAGATTSSDKRIDINSATAAELADLPGIGPVRSAAIVAGRPYEELKDLVTKKVLTKGVMDGAKGRMALANINTSSAADMAKTLPGVGDVRSQAIVAGRPYSTPDDLVTKKVLTAAQFGKIKNLVAY